MTTTKLDFHIFLSLSVLINNMWHNKWITHNQFLQYLYGICINTFCPNTHAYSHNRRWSFVAINFLDTHDEFQKYFFPYIQCHFSPFGEIRGFRIFFFTLLPQNTYNIDELYSCCSFIHSEKGEKYFLIVIEH